MIKFSLTTAEDIPQIRNWTAADAYHCERNSPSWWLSGNGLVAFRLDDQKGAVFYVRLDNDDEYTRLSVQFAPVEIVPKMRLARAMIETLPKVIEIAKQRGSKGLIFDSVSPTLIRFMQRFEFLQIVGEDCYLLLFGE